MPNSLQSQSSPYLKDASQQPVNWYIWGEEAFAKAKELDRPVIVSIGYSSCHWCRQMARDNYEDDYIASLMNRHFICIKVDREERPDLDLFYMEAARMFNQSAGWPLHAFCLPDGSPFWCGTYFPKEDKGQDIAPWPQVLLRIAEHYHHGREELEENGKNALANLNHSNNVNLSDPREWQTKMLITAGEILCKAHDDEAGGFTPAPKFPSPMKIDFLFSLSEAEAVRRSPEFSSRLDFCLEKTLGAMGQGSLVDHVHGGFFRYCLDRDWTSPHFEKMLSDNALLISTYSRSFRKFHKLQDRVVLENTLNWIEEEMGSPRTGYASSLAAETNGMEGAYYLWTYKEVEKVIGKKEADLLVKLWGPFAKTTTDLFLPKLVHPNKMPLEKQREILRKLKAAREFAGKPSRDEKRSCAQHALYVRALIDAGTALSDEGLIIRAREVLNWMESAFRLPDNSVSSILYPDQSKSPYGFLEDYSFWAESILSFGAISEIWDQGSLDSWIEKAEALINQAVERFKDPSLAGYFTTPENMEKPGPSRKKSWYDHAMPSGNSSLLRVFSILAKLGGNQHRWSEEYEEALGGYPKIIKQSPDGIGHALSAQTENSVGIIKLACPKHFMEKIFKKLSILSHRPIFLTQKEDICLEVNQQIVALAQDQFDEVLRVIWK